MEAETSGPPYALLHHGSEDRLGSHADGSGAICLNLDKLLKLCASVSSSVKWDNNKYFASQDSWDEEMA